MERKGECEEESTRQLSQEDNSGGHLCFFHAEASSRFSSPER